MAATDARAGLDLTPIRQPEHDAAAAAGPAQRAESVLESRWIDQALAEAAPAAPARPGERSSRGLVLGLLATAGVLACLRLLAAGPYLALDGPDADVVTSTLSEPALSRPKLSAPALNPIPGGPLKTLRGQPVLALVAADGAVLDAAAIGALQAPRDTVADADRQHQTLTRQRLAGVLQPGSVQLRLAGADDVTVPVAARGLSALGLGCWLLAVLALALLLAASMVALAAPGLPAALFVTLATAQALTLLLVAGDQLPGLGQPAWLAHHGLALRWAADAVLGAALLHLMACYPQRRARAAWIGGLAWGGGLALWAGLVMQVLPGAWWWAQGWTLACGLGAALMLHRRPPEPADPLARLLQRLVLATVLTGVLLTGAQALADGSGPGPNEMAAAAAWSWQVFVASLMLLGPFLSRTRQGLRQLALLAGISTVAVSLDLLLETGLDLGPGSALLVALAVSAALYALARRWVRRQVAATAGMSAERLFDQLYRVARALEPAPEQAGRQISALLREVFEPLECSWALQTVSRVRVTQDGSTLVVPVPAMGAGPSQAASAGCIVLRHARQGRRLFSADDQRLAERMIEQLSRAVAHDRAVEQGRTEERTRIAQDLHDDIGARLLTLMYRAPNAEIEEYIRHTLQDLKTLTRGLAASNHRLSHAAAEWKADLSQRLAAVGCDLRWSFSTDTDLTLNVVQWSGLTRVLRELVNNIISHARASQVEVSVQVEGGRLLLTVSDDGIGRAPEAWSHGLGLGGVRKRVKLLGGQVRWQEAQPRGVRCEVQAPLAEDARSP